MAAEFREGVTQRALAPSKPHHQTLRTESLTEDAALSHRIFVTAPQRRFFFGALLACVRSSGIDRPILSIGPTRFFTLSNLQVTLGTQSVLPARSLGLILPMTTNEFDVSVGSVLSFSSVFLWELTTHAALRWRWLLP